MASIPLIGAPSLAGRQPRAARPVPARREKPSRFYTRDAPRGSDAPRGTGSARPALARVRPKCAHRRWAREGRELLARESWAGIG
jgi:hypothetical protein